MTIRLLLDTHVAIWSVGNPGSIPLRIRQIISRADTEVFVSVVSLWEIAIKFDRGRSRTLPFSASTAMDEFAEAGFQTLDVGVHHAIAVGDLAVSRGDPFDRLILAQAVTESMRLVTHDGRLAAFSDTVISW